MPCLQPPIHLRHRHRLTPETLFLMMHAVCAFDRCHCLSLLVVVSRLDVTLSPLVIIVIMLVHGPQPVSCRAFGIGHTHILVICVFHAEQQMRNAARSRNKTVLWASTTGGWAKWGRGGGYRTWEARRMQSHLAVKPRDPTGPGLRTQRPSPRSQSSFSKSVAQWQSRLPARRRCRKFLGRGLTPKKHTYGPDRGYHFEV